MAAIIHPSNLSEINSLVNGTPQSNGLPPGFTSSALDNSITQKNNMTQAISDLEGMRSSFVSGGGNETDLDDMINALTAGASQMNRFKTHTVGIPNATPGQPGSLGIFNISRNASIGVSVTTIKETFGTAPANPCDILSGLLDSLLQGGEEVINAIVDALAPLLALIAAGVAAVILSLALLLATIITAILAVAALIADGLAALVDLLAGLVEASRIFALPSIFNDPCGGATLAQLGSSSLTSELTAANIF